MFDSAEELAEHYPAAHASGRIRCQLCGLVFKGRQLATHAATVHAKIDDQGESPDINGVESTLLKKAGDEEKARRRTRGPYRKSHAA
ncbi:MAG: hypothetical protein MN733_40270 [Nitrososphaera sp.]|nr:hypothetical protein [Nitrososphaera sp.]